MSLPQAHWKANKYRFLTKEKLQAMADSIADIGQLEPITFSAGPASPGLLIDGRNRWLACELVRRVPETIEVNFETEEDIIAYIEAKNDHKRHLTPEEEESNRQERIGRVVQARTEQKSLRTIAEQEGVSVAQVRRDLSAVPGGTPATVTGRDGKTYPSRLSISTPEERADKSGPSLSAQVLREEREKEGGLSEEQQAQVAESVARVHARVAALEAKAGIVPAPVDIKKGGLTESEKAFIAETVDIAFVKNGPYHPVTLLPSEAPAVSAPSEAPSKGAPAIMASQREDHNSPPEIIEAVTRFAPIALDPCSNAHSQVGATVALTIDDDGLHADWVALTPERGHIYINPPYDQETLALVHRRARYAAFRGRFVTTLVPAKTDQDWYQDAISGGAAAVCFIKGRLRFWVDGERQQGAAFPCLLIYYGSSAYQWAETVGGLGACIISPTRMITYQERQQEEGTK